MPLNLAGKKQQKESRHTARISYIQHYVKLINTKDDWWSSGRKTISSVIWRTGTRFRFMCGLLYRLCKRSRIIIRFPAILSLRTRRTVFLSGAAKFAGVTQSVGAPMVRDTQKMSVDELPKSLFVFSWRDDSRLLVLRNKRRLDPIL